MKRWLAGLFLVASPVVAAIPQAQRDALLAIYDSTGGAQWTRRDNWRGPAGTECTWFGVTCDETRSDVVDLNLSDNNLTGGLPPAIRHLTKVRGLLLYSNAMTGPIPPELAEMSSLELIYASDNDFSGTIPATLGSMAKLRILDLGGSRLEGTIPASLGNIASLEELHLGENQLRGEIPSELSRLTRLTALGLHANQLTGRIPDALGSLSKLEYLYLGDNQLSGEIPASLANLSSLLYLYLSYNRLSGSIPPQLGGLRSLEELHLGVNQLTGTIPKELGDLAALKVLSLAQNKLSGTIPDELFRATNLETLFLFENQLEGPIPSRIASLVKLQTLYLQDNKLSGPIPVELTTIGSLTTLLLSRNQLTGEIPRELSRLANLENVQLDGNKLRGSIPPELGSLAKLTRLSLEQNELTGTIPQELGRLSNLDTLGLSFNKLRGTIPDSLRDLRKMEQVSIEYNELSGTLPPWLGEWTGLVVFFAHFNDFTGTIPEGVANLTNLAYFNVADNFLTGTLPDFSRLGNLVYFVAGGNQLSGPIPRSIGTLTKATYLDLAVNAFSGPLPREIGQLGSVEYLSLWGNRLEGSIPAEIGGLKKAYAISLSGNRFTGTIPKEIGDLASLQYLDLSFNALRGPVPAEITRLTSLLDGSSDFRYNALFTTDGAVRAFLDRKQGGGAWHDTQTVMPANVRVTAVSDRSATVEWTPIAYNYDPGGYQVVASKTAGGAPVAIATTSGKDLASIVVRNLEPLTTYHFIVAAVTHPQQTQENLIVSDFTAPVSATTTARVLAPADVALTESTSGLVQIGGVAANEDSFTLTNFGDATAELSIAKDGDFFTLEADAITIAGGATRTIKLRSVPRPVNTYYGGAYVIGDGAGDGIYIPVVLLSVAKPAGSVVAEALDTIIEIKGLAGAEDLGIARFRNSGTAPLSGIVIADQPWVVPAPETITIEPGQTYNVNFRIVRSRRPQSEGALTATLSLVYVDGAAPGAFQTAPSSGINVSKVTIVDVTKPPVTPAPFGLAITGETAWFIPGVASALRGYGSDISILNGSSSRPVSDLRLFFSLAGGSSSVATLQPLAANQAITLTNVVANVYNAAQATGTVQVRSAAGGDLAVLAKMTALRSAGTFSGEMPVFRADRSAGRGEKIYLAGLRPVSDLVIQEVAGTATTVRIELFDANGTLAAPARDALVEALGLLEIRDVAASAATAVVTNSSGGRLVGYARVTDSATGDAWSVVDWSRQNRYALTEPMRVPYAERVVSSGRGRRRAVHAEAVNQGSPTDLTLFNPGNAAVKALLQVTSANGRTSEREIALAPLQTVTLPNVVTTTDAATAHLLITPLGRGTQVVVTARSPKTAVPVVGALDGLRVGQARSFGGLEDSAAFTTAYGFVETTGQAMRVRARLFLDKERSVVTETVFRDFDLPAQGQIVLAELVRSFAGASRDTAYGDLHNLRLQIEVIEGKGAVVPFVVVTDNGSGDSLLRMQ